MTRGRHVNAARIQRVYPVPMGAENAKSVYLQFGEQQDADGEVTDQSRLPSDAYQTALTVRRSAIGNEAGAGADEVLEVWVVPR